MSWIGYLGGFWWAAEPAAGENWKGAVGTVEGEGEALHIK